ncbi:hypothetical protein ACVOMV_09305 [Mesorhizobium atlanticum]
MPSSSPGRALTNTITAIGQAAPISVPMLVISGVNATDTLGKGLGLPASNCRTSAA